MSVVVMGCERVSPLNAVEECGWCMGKNTVEPDGKRESLDELIVFRCPFRFNCQQSIYIRPLVQKEMFPGFK